MPTNWIRPAATVMISVLLNAPVQAQNVYTNFQEGPWSDDAPWANAVPSGGGSNDYVIVFDNAATYVSTNDLGAPGFVLNQLVFLNAGVTLAGSSLVFSASSDGATPPAIQKQSGSSFTIRNDLVLATNLFVEGDGGVVTLNGAISGDGAFIKGGSQSVIMNGTNTYSGGTYVSNGSMTVRGIIGGYVAVNDDLGGFYNIRLGQDNALDATTFLSLESPNGDGASFLQLDGYDVTLAGITNWGADSGRVVIENLIVGTTATVTFAVTAPSHYTGKFRDNNTGIDTKVALVVDGPGALHWNLNNSAGGFSGNVQVRGGTLSVGNINNIGTPGNLGRSNTVTLGAAAGSMGRLEYTGTSLAVSRDFVLGAGSGALGVIDIADPGQTLTLISTVSGAGTLVKDGPGRLRFWGTNTYEGGTILQAGMLTVTNDHGFGAVPAAPAWNITFASNSTLQGGAAFSLHTNRTVVIPAGVTATFDMPFLTMTINGRIEGGGIVVKTGGQGLIFGGVNDIAAALLYDGTLSIGAQANIGGAATPLTFAGGMLQVTGTGISNLDSHPVNWTNFSGGIDVNSAANTFTITNVISGPGFFRKSGQGALRLTSANTYTGLTIVSGGQLVVLHPEALGPATEVTTVASGGSVVLANGMVVTGETIIINGNGSNNGGALQSAGVATNEWLGDVVMAGAARVGSQKDGLLVLRGAIINTNGNTLELGAGTGDTQLGVVELAGNSTYNGYTRLVRGTVRLGVDQALPATTTLDVNFYNTVGANAVLDLNGHRQLVGGLTRSSTGGGASIVTNSSAVMGFLTVETRSNLTYRGELGGNMGFTMAGTGTQILVSSGVMDGPTAVSNGTLLVQGVLGTGVVTVSSGGTLGGTGTVDAAVVSAGTVSPGSSIGTLLVSRDYVQQGGGTLRLELGGTAAPGTSHDQLVVAGAAQLDGVLQLVLTNGYVPAFGDTLAIMTAGSVTGQFTSINPPLAGTNAWTVSSAAGVVLLSVTSPPATSGYDAFALQIPNPLQRGYQDDADGDGYANLLEYATGGDPTNMDATARMQGARTNGVFALKFSRNTAAVDVTLIVEGGHAVTNDTVWNGIATNSAGSWGGAPNVSESGGPGTVSVTVQDTAGVTTNRFLRLRVTRP